MNIQKNYLLFKLISFFLLSNIIYAGTFVSTQDKVNFICEKIFKQNYDYVDKICEDWIKYESRNPLGYLFKAANLITRSIDYEDELNYDEIKKLLNECEKHSSESNYFSVEVLKGLINSLKAYADYQRGDYLSAFINGYKATNFFSEELEKNPDSPEALIAIGIFKYWSSRKSEFLHWLPFIKDERETGINLIKKGLSKNSPFNFLGFHSLAWIYIDNKQPQEAIKICNKMIDDFEESRFFNWTLARSFEDIDLEKSVFYYKKTLRLIRKVKMNGYNEVVILHILAQLDFKLGKYDSALSRINEIERVELSKYAKDRLEDRFKRIEKLKNQLKSIRN